MPNSSKSDVVLINYPFTDFRGFKIRPVVVIHAPHPSQDAIVVPLTSQTSNLLPGEFALLNWREAGLRVPTAVKRGFATIQDVLVIRSVGRLTGADAQKLDQSLRAWLGL
jgi:mRNA interferase MazF